jgi:cytochrome c biogenesis protein CcmG, thiol:disulfide interchange protein DsbE
MPAVKTERAIQVLIGICLMILAWAVVDTFRERIVVAGDTAPAFQVTTDAGRTVSRADFGGKLLVLNFWATWCPPCIEEMPSLNQFQQQFAGSGLVVVGVSVDQNEQAYRKFLDRVKVAFATARDPEARISSEYGTFKFPETYIINRDGKVVEKIVGPTNWTDEGLLTRVKNLLAS